MVDTRVGNDEKAALAEEISLAENLIREAMSPADECRSYRAALDKGETEEDVARRLGVTVRHVQGRLRLADLAEPIFNALAEGKITLDVDRKSVVEGKSVSVRVDIGVRPIIKKKENTRR